MKRAKKNVLMITIVTLLSIGMIFTYSYAKSHITSNSVSSMNGNTPQSMPSGTGGNSDSNNIPEKPSGSNDMTPPDNNTGDNQNSNQGTPPEKTSDDNGTPPAKPDDNTSSSDSNSANNNGINGMPNNGNSSNGNTPPSMPSDMNANNSSNKLTWPYYLIFISSSLGISLLVMYLIMSEFNKKSFKETFTNKDKVMIDVLGVIVLTGILSTGSVVLTNNFLSNSGGNSGNPGMGEMNGGSNSASYSAIKEITSDTTITDGTYTSTNSDENAIMVSGDATADISNVTVTKSGDSDGGDSTSFYGTNSGIIAKDGATLNIENATITTDATGANGVFSYGGSAITSNSSSDGTTVNISNSKITTTKDNSGGIMTTGGGVMNATDLEINTAGVSSAAIRSDRGGGTVNVNGGTYTTTGQGSPTIYSTANITVKNATLKATASEGVVIEGKNSVTLDNVTLVDTNNKLNGQSTTYKNIFLYQSMSGDADTGTATFNASNSKITTNKGDTLYVTNTSATITLENNTIVNNDSTGNFLRVQKDSWGVSGSNGGNVTLNLKKQKITGNIVIDSLSTLVMSLTNTSSYEGTINADNTAKSISLTLDKTSKIKLTGNSYVTSLTNEDTSNSNIDFNGYKLYVNGTAIN